MGDVHHFLQCVSTDPLLPSTVPWRGRDYDSKSLTLFRPPSLQCSRPLDGRVRELRKRSTVNSDGVRSWVGIDSLSLIVYHSVDFEL